MADAARVLDASAIVAFIQGEPGGARVAALLESAAVSAVNLSEALAALVRRGMPEEMAWRAVGRLGLAVHSFGPDDARRTTRLYAVCPDLSLGDRACLALAQSLGVSALTADTAWKRATKDVQIEFTR